jgi:pimeloyl-ACP methyl ester carboxylesterase
MTKSPEQNEHPSAPGWHLIALELRAPWELWSLLPSWPVLSRAAAGDGHPVLVFPGLTASDGSTLPLRAYLKSLGYDVSGWNQGYNFGPRAGVLETAREQILDIYRTTGQAVSLIGWSLGGVYARELAKELPDKVRCVITLGTPFGGSHTSTNAWRLYELAAGHRITEAIERFDLAGAPPVPTTSIYSRSDGVVAWQASLQAPQADQPDTENIEVFASHIGLGVNPSAWWVVADRLAQVPGHWTPFSREGGWARWLFPDPLR